jgi:hypothetical protein
MDGEHVDDDAVAGGGGAQGGQGPLGAKELSSDVQAIEGVEILGVTSSNGFVMVTPALLDQDIQSPETRRRHRPALAFRYRPRSGGQDVGAAPFSSISATALSAPAPLWW